MMKEFTKVHMLCKRRKYLVMWCHDACQAELFWSLLQCPGYCYQGPESEVYLNKMFFFFNKFYSFMVA